MQLIDDETDIAYCPQTEAQNCLREAMMARAVANSKAAAAITAVIKAGRFAVVARYPYYCRSTDAFAGNVDRLHGEAGTYADAVALIPSGEADDVMFRVIPQPPRPIPSVIHDDDNEFI